MGPSQTNKLIVFEGIDGVGKTTLCKKIIRELARRNVSAVQYETCENKRGGFNLIKLFIKREAPLESSFFFYLASAVYKSSVIEKLLRDKWVVCDRYVYSTFAYHLARGLNKNFAALYHALPVRRPDFFFLVIAKESVRRARMRGRKKMNHQDAIPKRRGTLPYRMECFLRSFRPTVIDNSSPDIKSTVRLVLKKIRVPGSAK